MTKKIMKLCSKCNRLERKRKKVSPKSWYYKEIFYMIEFLSKNYLRTQREEKEKEKEKKEKEKESIISQPSAAENMDVDEHNSNNSNSGGYVCFLRKVLREESGDNHHIHIHMLMAIAVHAILIESGFVGYDPISGDRVDHKFHQVFVVDDDHCRPSVSFCYTLSEILENNNNNGHKPQTVVAKLDFESFGQCLTVSAGSSRCGSEEEGSVVFQVSLYDHKLESILRFPLLAQHRNGLEQFFLSVRDELAFPLKIKLREEAGLPSLPCFMGLHSDLKMKILEFLPGNEVAKLECTCKEMRILSAKKQSNKFWETRIPCCTCDLRHHGKRFIYWKKVYEDYHEETIGVNMFLEEERQEMMKSREKNIKEPKNKGKSLLKGKRIKIT